MIFRNINSKARLVRQMTAALVLVVIVAFAGPAPERRAGSAETAKLIQQALASQQSNQKMLDDIARQKDQLAGAVNQYTGELAWLNERSQEEQETYERLLAEKEAALQAVDEAIASYLSAEEMLADKEESYKERLQAMFEFRNKPVLQVFLESGNIQGFFTNMEIIRAIAEYDDQMLDDLEAARIESEIRRQDALEKQLAAAALVEIKEAELDELQYKISRSSADLASAQEQLAAQQSREEAFLAQSDELGASIRELQVQFESQRNHEEEERKRREAEERRLREEEERKQREAEERIQREAEERIQREAEERRQLEAAENQKQQLAAAERSQREAEQSKQRAAEEAKRLEAARQAAQPKKFGNLVWPVPSSTWITSPFQPEGRTDLPGQTRPHMGADIGAPFNTPIVAVANGTVIVSYNPAWQGWYSGGYGYGNYVIVDHGNGLATLYSHLRNCTVSVGDYVLAGDVVGLMGSTGNSSGSHLHFEVRVNGTPVDPLQPQYIGRP